MRIPSSPTYTVSEPTCVAHIGLREESFDKLASIDWEGQFASYFIDGDGFAAWGEDLGEDINDTVTYHVGIAGYNIRNILDALRSVFTDEDLVTFGQAAARDADARFSEKRISFSEVEDWANQFLSLETLTPTLI